MVKQLSTGIFLFLMTFTFAASAHAAEPPMDFKAVPADLQSSVTRMLSSKPQDLFAVLDNGLTVLLRHTGNSDLVSAQVYVRAGSLYEGESMTGGISHYLEHVVSGGSTGSFTEAEAKQRLRTIGGETNASTSYDRTIYYINTSAGHWKDALDLLMSYVSESKLDPREVAREKAVIQQEYKLRENDADSELWNLFMKTAFRVHPVRNPILGYEEVFVLQDRQNLTRYYEERYQPENMVVAVAGNIDPVEVLRFLVEKTKGFKRKACMPIALPMEPDQTNPRFSESELPIARIDKVILGFPSVSLHNADLYPLDVLAFLLGQGETSRLYLSLKDKQNKVLSVTASNWTPAYVKGQFMISMDLPPENWPRVLNDIEEELTRFKKEPVTAEELERAKKTAIAQHIFGKETVSAMASSLASSYFDTGDPYFDEQYLEGLRAVTPEQILDVANRYLDTNRMSVAVVKPKAQREASEQALAAPSQPSAVHYEKLGNGMKVLLQEDSTLPMVTVQIYGIGGLLLEQQQPAGISAFTASLLTAGTNQRSKLDLARAIEDRGGSIQSGSNNNTYYVALRVLKEDLGLALDILADMVQNAQFPQQEIDKKRVETLLAIRTLDENWQTEIYRLFKKNYFRESPYSHERLGTEQSVSSFTREELLSFYRKMVNPHHSVLAVYGDFDQKQLLPEIQKKLANWSGEPYQAPNWPNEAQALKSSRSVEVKNEKTSAALFIGANGLDLSSSERPTLDLLNTILSGAGTPSGRLFEALRGGREDLVYLVGSFPFYGRDAGFFGVITQTTLANLQKVQEIILQNVKRLQQEKVDQKEIEAAKNILLTSHRMELESLAAKAQSAAVNEALGLGWDYDQKYDELVERVGAEQIQQLAKKLFTHTLVVQTLPQNPVEALSVPQRARDAKAD